MIRIILLTLATALFFSANLVAQERLRGINVYGALSEEGILKLASWKVNVIRYGLISIPADGYTETEYFNWLEQELNTLDSLLPIFAANNIKVILNLHTPPGGLAVKKEPALHRIFKESWAQQAFINNWKYIANRYLGNSQIVAFELVNEPAEKSVATGLLNWKNLATTVINEIRIIDPTRAIVVQPIYGSYDQLTRLGKLPFGNITYSIHFYTPFSFTKQGLPGYKGKIQYPNKSLTRAKLKKFLNRAAKFQTKHNVPISVGEFAVVRWAPKTSAIRYLDHLVQYFESKGWDWMYHAFRESHVWSLEHGEKKKDLTPSTSPTAREILLRDYFDKNY